MNIVEQGINIDKSHHYEIHPKVSKGDVIKLRFDWVKNVVDIANVPIFYGFLISAEDKDIKRKFLNDIKHSYGVPQDKLIYLIRKGVQLLNQNTPLSSFNVVVYPKNSGILNKDIARIIKEKTGTALIVDDAFVKESIENISIDYDKIMRYAKDEKEGESVLNNLMSAIESSVNTQGELKMKRLTIFQRRLVSNFLKFKDPISERLVGKLIAGHVLIIDDIFTSGQSFNEMINVLNNMGVALITGFALFKND